jgi:hypothetical protein
MRPKNIRILWFRQRFGDTAKNTSLCKKTRSLINKLLYKETELTFMQFYSTIFSINEVFNGKKSMDGKKVTEKDGESGPENI